MVVAFVGFVGGWAKGLSGPFDWFAALIGIAAGIALFRFKVGVIQLIGVCALIGLAYSFARSMSE